jgi:hypothetical protein
MDLSDFDKITSIGLRPSTQINKSNPALNYIEEAVKTIDKNRPKVEELISKLGKFDERFIDREPTTAHSPEAAECLSYLVKPEVLIEKIGNKNKGVYKGTHIDYGDLNLQRTQYKEDKNVFNMWVKGEIPGSLVATNNAGFTMNLLNNETFFGCSYPWIKSKEDWVKLTENL